MDLPISEAIAGTVVLLAREAVAWLARRRALAATPPTPTEPAPQRQPSGAHAALLRHEGDADWRALFEGAPCCFLVLSPSLFILGASDAYLAATMTARSDIVGKHLFKVFPDNQADTGADGVANLSASLERVLTRQRPDEMHVQRYDVRRPDGTWEERRWLPCNVPILDAEGHVRHILHHVIDVTDRRSATA